MEYSNALKKFCPGPSAAEVERMLEQIRPLTEKNRNREVYRKCFSCIDLTSLGSTDSHEHIERFVRKAVEFPSHYPDIPNVASVCVYPAFVETAGVAIGAVTETAHQVEIYPSLVHRLDSNGTLRCGATTEIVNSVEVWPYLVRNLESRGSAVMVGALEYHATVEIYPTEQEE